MAKKATGTKKVVKKTAKKGGTKKAAPKKGGAKKAGAKQRGTANGAVNLKIPVSSVIVGAKAAADMIDRVLATYDVIEDVPDCKLVETMKRDSALLKDLAESLIDGCPQGQAFMIKATPKPKAARSK